GLKLLQIDVADRRRELDVSAARLERRVASLQIEADAAQQRADTMARRAGARAPAKSKPGGAPVLSPAGAPHRAAHVFLDELGRAMSGSVAPTPQRILIVVDAVDALPPAEARRFVEGAVRAAGRGAAVVVAADLTRLSDDPRELAE